MSPKPTKKKDPKVKVLVTHVVGELMSNYETTFIERESDKRQFCLTDFVPESLHYGINPTYGRWKVTIEFEELKKSSEKKDA